MRESSCPVQETIYLLSKYIEVHPQIMILERLRSARFEASAHEDWRSSTFQTFATLPCMETLTIDKFCDPVTLDELSVSLLPETRQPTITDLAIHESCIHPSTMIDTLEQFPKLQHFLWDGRGLGYGDIVHGQSVAPPDICRALQIHTKDSLRSLIIKPHERWYSHHLSDYERRPFIKDLDSFRSLQYLELQVECVMTELPPTGGSNITVLPTSLQHLSLHCEKPEAPKLLNLLRSLPAIKAERKFQLSRLDCHAYEDTKHVLPLGYAADCLAALEGCVSVGISARLLPENCRDHHHWDRFCERLSRSSKGKLARSWIDGCELLH